MRGGGGRQLLERGGELHQIELALAGAAHGRGRLVVLYGSAGTGRSSLLDEAVELASSRRFEVLRARGSEWERGYPFGVARQLLETRAAELPEAELRSLFDGAAAAAVAAVGLASPEHAARRGGFDEIHGLYLVVSRIAAGRRLIIAVDDVHWCDLPSLDFLCFLGHRARQLPIVVLLSWRRGERGVHAGRLQGLAGERDTIFLSPAPLSPDGVRVLMAQELGSDPADDVVNLVHARAGGVPFLVSELVAALRQRRIEPTAAAVPAIAAVTPERVRRDVAARLGRHPEPVRRLAHAVAVLGDGCSLTHAARLAGVDYGKASSLADVLIRAGVLRFDGALFFPQPLVRDATGETISPAEQASLHAAAAAALLEAGGDADTRRVAAHLLRSAPAADPRFAQVLREAGRSAIRDGALAFARRCLQRALEEEEAPDAGRSETLAMLATLSMRLGDFAAAEQHLRHALTLARSQAERLPAAIACAEAIVAARGPAPAVELLTSELDRCPDRDSGPGLGLRAAIAGLRLCCHVAQPQLAAGPRELLEDRPGRPPAELALLAVRASLAVLHGTAGAGQVIEACRRVPARGSRDEALAYGAATRYFACRAALLAESSGLAAGALPPPPAELSPETAADHDLAALAVRCQLHLSRGDLVAAETEAAVVVALLGTLPPTALRSLMRDDATVVRTIAALYRGRAHQARQHLSELARAAEGRNPHPAVLPMTIMLAVLEGRAGDMASDSVEAQARRAPPGIAAPGVSWRPALALAYHDADRPQDALRLAGEHLEAAQAWGAPSYLARALLTQAAVSPATSRLDPITQALELLQGGHEGLELALARIELGVALRREHRRKQAQQELMRGAALAQRCGAGALVERARAELVVAGARPRRRAFSGLDSLTPSERRVAELAATQMTTRQIARALTISMKTVGGQLTAVYQKLDVHDRRALAAVLAKAGGADGGQDGGDGGPA